MNEDTGLKARLRGTKPAEGRAEDQSAPKGAEAPKPQGEAARASPSEIGAQEGGAPHERSGANKPNKPPPDREELNSTNYFQSMQQFLYNCRHDKRLTPATQLVYRTLVALSNSHYWAARFVVSDAELQEITHITSRQDITRIKRNLKNLGYIDFYGNPSKYMVYGPPVYQQVREQVCSATPQTPRF